MFIGILMGFGLSSILFYLREYMSINNLKLNWEWILPRLFYLIVILYLIYSFLGISISNEYIQENGNVCKGFRYGMKLCSGDINAE